MTKNGNIPFVVLFDDVTILTEVSGAPLSSFILAMILYYFFSRLFSRYFKPEVCLGPLRGGVYSCSVTAQRNKKQRNGNILFWLLWKKVIGSCKMTPTLTVLTVACGHLLFTHA